MKRPATSPLVNDQDGESSLSSMDDGAQASSSNHVDTYKPPKKKKKKGEEDVYDWTEFLGNPGLIAASVVQVKHV